LIDKIETRLQSSVTFRKEIRALIRQIDYSTGKGFMRPSRFYVGVGDLRPLGIDALLHYHCKKGGQGNHKLEMLDTGKKPYSALVAQLEAVIDAPLDDLGIMRVDFCADIPDVPVSWFHPRTRILYKRLSNQIGPLKNEIISKAGIETISAGRRPNVFRIYDKVAESKMQFRRMVKRSSKDADLVDFEKEFGFSPESILTRVERQYGGGRIPEEVSTFGKLCCAAPTFDPFDVLIITGETGANLPSVKECDSVTEYLAGKELNRMVSEVGLQAARRWLNKETGGNGARTLKRFHRFLPGSDRDSMTVKRIFDTYRTSVMRQLAS
jgi:hypothetical protein